MPGRQPRKDLVKRKAAYEWYTMSGVARVAAGFPLTYDEMAHKLGISLDELEQWEKDFYDGNYLLGNYLLGEFKVNLRLITFDWSLICQYLNVKRLNLAEIKDLLMTEKCY